jgi:prephenate dehydratase
LSAELVKSWQDSTKAAIASRAAGELHGLKILNENIQDDTDNITRFIVLEKRDESAKSNSANKFSAILHTPQTPGSLLRALDIFNNANLNLSTLHSAFIANSAFEMKFFVEFEDEEKLPDHFAEQLKTVGCELELLGNYSSAQIPINGLK